MNVLRPSRKPKKLFLAAILTILLLGWGTFVPQAVAGPQIASQSIAQAETKIIAQSTQNGANDPLESVNRAIFSFNEFLQDLLIRPMAEMYVLFLPEFVRDGVRNVLNNIRTPVVLVNDLLQGEGGRALTTTKRFFINTTVGVGGIIDVADRMGIKGHNEDFGQTLARWGVGEGLYLVLPVLGPSNPRDGIAKLADFYMDPVSQWAGNTDHDEVTWTRTVLGGVDSYSRVMDDLRKLKETSIDYYAAVRSISRQKRKTEIRNGKPDEGAPLPDIQYDFNAGLSTGQ